MPTTSLYTGRGSINGNNKKKIERNFDKFDKSVGTHFDEPRLSVFGFLVHVDVAHVDVDSELFDAHPNGSTRWRRRHVNELDAARREAHLLPRVHSVSL